MAEWPGQAQGDPVGPLRDERSGRPWGVVATRGRVRRLTSLFPPGASVSWSCPHVEKRNDWRNPERSAACRSPPWPVSPKQRRRQRGHMLGIWADRDAKSGSAV